MAPWARRRPSCRSSARRCWEALKAPDVIARLKASDQAVVGYDGAKTAAVLAADSKKWGEIARKIQLGLD